MSFTFSLKAEVFPPKLYSTAEYITDPRICFLLVLMKGFLHNVDNFACHWHQNRVCKWKLKINWVFLRLFKPLWQMNETKLELVFSPWKWCRPVKWYKCIWTLMTSEVGAQSVWMFFYWRLPRITVGPHLNQTVMSLWNILWLLFL